MVRMSSVMEEKCAQGKHHTKSWPRCLHTELCPLQLQPTLKGAPFNHLEEKGHEMW